MSETLSIDGPITSWYYSFQLVKNFLKDKKNKKVEIEISSFGGQLHHALAIYDIFAEHGQITTKLYGFIASAATIIALPTYTKISKNAFYLIHKVSESFFLWDSLNEDTIEDLIKSLTDTKSELQKMTLVAAKNYYNRAKSKGKSLQDVLNLMKEDKWLTAEEAMEWGFVDEIYSPEKNQMKAFAQKEPMFLNIIEAEGMPLPPQISSKKNQIQKPMNKNLVLPQLNKLFGIDELVSTDEGSFISERWLKIINQKLDDLENDVNKLNQDKTGMSEHADTLQQTISDKTNEIDKLNQQITNLTSQVNTLEQEKQTLTDLVNDKPHDGTKPNNIPPDHKLDKSGVDWKTVDNLPHNRFVDANY